MSEKTDAVVALSGDFSEDLSTIGPETTQRMDKAIEVVRAEDVPIIVAGNYHFRWRQPTPRPISHLMHDYARNAGIAEDMICVEDKSLDTIGDAVLTKINVTEPNGWKKLRIVTSENHLPRSCSIFKHVMGEEYTIDGTSAGSSEHPKLLQKMYEYAGGVLTKAVLSGTDPGNTEEIQERLFKIIPGYEAHSTASRLASISEGLLAKQQKFYCNY